MNGSEVMTAEVAVANPDQSVRHIGQAMREVDIGSVPAGEDDHLVGTA